MKLYNKSFKCNYDELITYYPLFYREVREMDELLKAQGRLADGLENGIEQIFSDCFIDTADSSVIACYERIIGIDTDNSKSLEERRSLVKSHLIGTGKISASLIAEMIGTYTGAPAECTLGTAPDGQGGCLYIAVDRGSKDFINFTDIAALLSVKIPAHIMFELSMRCQKSIGISASRRLFETNFPDCGQHFCGQELML